MEGRIAGEALPKDVAGCESLIQRHLEYGAEIRSREPQISEFIRVGENLTAKGHLLVKEIQDKVSLSNEN